MNIDGIDYLNLGSDSNNIVQNATCYTEHPSSGDSHGMVLWLCDNK